MKQSRGSLAFWLSKSFDSYPSSKIICIFGGFHKGGEMMLSFFGLFYIYVDSTIIPNRWVWDSDPCVSPKRLLFLLSSGLGVCGCTELLHIFYSHVFCFSKYISGHNLIEKLVSNIKIQPTLSFLSITSRQLWLQELLHICLYSDIYGQIETYWLLYISASKEGKGRYRSTCHQRLRGRLIIFILAIWNGAQHFLPLLQS